MDNGDSYYALIDADGLVTSVIIWGGDVEKWQPPEGIEAIVVPANLGVSAGWTYAVGEFHAPPALPVPDRSPEEIAAANTATRNYLLDMANRVIPALQDAVDLGDESANPTLLTAWKQFRVNVNKVDITLESPAWPSPPQNGYGSSVTADPQEA